MARYVGRVCDISDVNEPTDLQLLGHRLVDVFKFKLSVQAQNNTAQNSFSLVFLPFTEDS